MEECKTKMCTPCDLAENWLRMEEKSPKPSICYSEPVKKTNRMSSDIAERRQNKSTRVVVLQYEAESIPLKQDI